MTAALEGGEWSKARLGRTLLPGKTRYPLYRRMCGPQGRSGLAEYFVPTGIFLFEPIILHAIYNQLNERSSISAPYLTPHLLFASFIPTEVTTQHGIVLWGVTYRHTKILTYRRLSSTGSRATPSTSVTVTPRSEFEPRHSTRNRAHKVASCTCGENCPTSLSLSSPSPYHFTRVAVAEVRTVSTGLSTLRAVSTFPLGAVAWDHKSLGLTCVCHRLLQ